MLGNVRASLFLIIALGTFVLLPPSVSAIDPNPDVDKGTKPGDWIYEVVGANKDKWDIRAEKIPLTNYVIPFRGLSPGMLKILETGIKQGADWNPQGVCDAAAVNQGWSGLSNSMVGGAGLAAVLEGVGLIQNIMGAQKLPSITFEKIEKKIREAIKEGAKDKIKELFKGIKPEVYISRALWGDCSLAILAIWDKEAGTYEIIVYGDCDCKSIRTFMSYQQKKLKTFALRLTGTVSLKLEGDDIAFEARSGSKAVHANCKCPSSGAAGQPEPKEPPDKPQEPPAEIPVPSIPPEDITTKCKECQSIVDDIKRAHAERKKIMRDAQEAQDFYLAAVKAGRKKEASEFKVQVLQLGVQRLQVERKLRDLAGQLAGCEKEKCGPKAPGPAAGPEKTGAQGTCPPCQNLEDQVKKIDDEIQKKNVEVDNARRIWEKEGPDSDKGKKARSDYERLLKEVENLSKQANDLQEKLTTCTKENCPPQAFDSCLVGTWECTDFKQPSQFVTEGGTGFRVTFKSDGTQIVDYSNMKPLKSGKDTTIFSGTATARISTKDGVAKIEATEKADVTMKIDWAGVKDTMKVPGLGVGGLGSTKDNNNYKCTETSLEYRTSVARDAHANCTVKLTRVK